jgi:hypothetical protein
MEEAPGTIARPRELLSIFLLGLGLALIMTWPLATDLAHLGRTLATDADGQFSIWNIAWVARTIVADPVRLFDANIFFPHRTTLAYSEANLLEGALAVPVYWLSRNPWLTLNFVMLAGFASAYAGAYLLLRYLCGDRRAAAALAVAYAFCPYVMSHLSHIQLLFTGGIPLSLLLLHRIADEAAGASVLSRGIALGVALAAQALSCAYYGIFAGLMVGYVTLVLAFTRRLWSSTPYWTAIAAGAVTSIVIVTPFFMPYLRVQEESGFARTILDAARNSADASSYLASAARAHGGLLNIARAVGPFHEVLFPGFLALILGTAGAIVALRDAPPSRNRETLLIYGTLAAIAFWASFGPAAGLYRVLFHLPTFSFLRAPSRFGLVVVLGLTAIGSIALSRLLRVLPERRRLMGGALALVAAIADVTVIPIRWYPAPAVPSPYRVLAASPRAPVAEFPFYGDRMAFPLHTQYMLFSTSHWMPLVNGYSDVIPRDFREAAPVLESFPSTDAFNVLARRRVRYIGVHWDMYVGRADEIRGRLVPFLPNLRELASDERMTLYEVLKYP